MYGHYRPYYRNWLRKKIQTQLHLHGLDFLSRYEHPHPEWIMTFHQPESNPEHEIWGSPIIHVSILDISCVQYQDCKYTIYTLHISYHIS